MPETRPGGNCGSTETPPAARLAPSPSVASTAAGSITAPSRCVPVTTTRSSPITIDCTSAPSAAKAASRSARSEIMSSTAPRATAGIEKMPTSTSRIASWSLPATTSAESVPAASSEPFLNTPTKSTRPGSPVALVMSIVTRANGLLPVSNASWRTALSSASVSSIRKAEDPSELSSFDSAAARAA